MFDYMWENVGEKKYEKETIVNTINAQKIIPTIWSEHCVECSAPECYKTCSIYRRRDDGNCVRINNGICALGFVENVRSGAILEFRRWAKIECIYACKALPLKSVNGLYKKLDFWTTLFSGMAKSLPGNTFKWCLTRAIYSLRQRYMIYLLNKKGINCKRLQLKMCLKGTGKLIVEVKTLENLLYRNSIELSGEVETVSIELPIFDDKTGMKFLSIYPENFEKNSIYEFQFLELVENIGCSEDIREPMENPSKKVKCVVWDLDHTLWDGVLIEDDHLELNQEVVDIIKRLDAKGIVNSVCSKNDYDLAYEKIKEYGLEQYFVFSKINWNPKSVNIEKFLKEINVSPDTVVFVDDNVFERAEVSSRFPEIVSVDVKDIGRYVENERFKVTISEETRNRRRTYQMLEQQQRELSDWEGDIDEFLLNCQMTLTIGEPRKNEIGRCYELIQRTNQLNASGRRLTMEEVQTYWESEAHDTYVLMCEDKFGVYGIIGFAIIRRDKIPLISDFVISCRVANKKVEHAFIRALARKSAQGKVQISYKKTDRNEPIFKVVRDLKMSLLMQNDERQTYEYALETSGEYVEVVKVLERLDGEVEN